MALINVFAPAHLDPFDSYGLIGCELVKGLSALGAYVNAIALGYAQHDNQDSELKQLTSKPIKPTFGGILLGYPTTYDKHPLALQGQRIGLTMFESSKIPPNWVDTLNSLDAVIVPSQFCHDSFLDCGVTVPIHIVPLGVSETYQPCRRVKDRPYTFLAFGDRGKRKGWMEAQQAFVNAFGNNMDYKLIIKARDIKGVRATPTNRNIQVIRQDMSEQELYALYCRCDCMVFPTWGEGFGLPPREFAATGGLVIATNWGGTADNLHNWGAALDYKLVKADWQGIKKFQGQDLGVWAKPDVDHLSELMKAASEIRFNPTNNWARANYSWARFSKRVWEIWQQQ